eukprot:2513859-Rhodomonas_salina.1
MPYLLSPATPISLRHLLHPTLSPYAYLLTAALHLPRDMSSYLSTPISLLLRLSPSAYLPTPISLRLRLPSSPISPYAYLPTPSPIP